MSDTMAVFGIYDHHFAIVKAPEMLRNCVPAIL